MSKREFKSNNLLGVVRLWKDVARSFQANQMLKLLITRPSLKLPLDGELYDVGLTLAGTR